MSASACRPAAGFDHLLGSGVTGWARLGGGRNSRVWRLEDAGGHRWAGKEYADPAGAGGRRLRTEWRALHFLRGRGYDAVPEPVARDRALGLAVFSLLPGAPPRTDRLDSADADRLAAHALALHRLSRHGGEDLPAASEACLAPSGYADTVRARLERLLAVPAADALHRDLRAFLERDLAPLYRRERERADAALHAQGLDPAASLPRQALTLSQSDWGLHNAVRREDGSLAFVDFEFFGWDDPAKMACDFLFHPAMDAPQAERIPVVRAVVAATGGEAVAQRMHAAYTMTGLKWCLLLLNEFLPEGGRRRAFAHAGSGPSSSGGGAEDLRVRQLNRARALLERLQRGEGPPTCLDTVCEGGHADHI
jgi:hypothetical protein